MMSSTGISQATQSIRLLIKIKPKIMSKPIETPTPESIAEPGTNEELARVRLRNQIATIQSRIDRLEALAGNSAADKDSAAQQLEAAKNEKQQLQAELADLSGQAG